MHYDQSIVYLLSPADRSSISCEGLAIAFMSFVRPEYGSVVFMGASATHLSNDTLKMAERLCECIFPTLYILITQLVLLVHSVNYLYFHGRESLQLFVHPMLLLLLIHLN